jgi:sugar phosphate isomerase/epimerase
VKGAPTDYMTVGLLQAAAFPDAAESPGGGVAAVRHIASDGFFGAVETTIASDGTTQSRALLSQSKLLVDFDAGTALYRTGASLCSLDRYGRAQAVQLGYDGIDAAYAIGACRLSVVSGRDPGEHLRAAATDALVDSILALYEYARAAGALELSLKMADRAVDKCFLIGPTLDGVAVAQRVREHYPQFGLVLNLAHLPLLGEDLETAVRESAPFLARVHIGNCIVANGDSHPRFGVPGSAIGAAELCRLLRALLSVGYLSAGGRNVVAFEVRPAPHEDPLEVIAESKRALCQAWARV